MATTYDKILTYLTSAIPELSSVSGTAIYKKITEVVSIIIDNTITELNNDKSIIENIIGLQRYGKSEYYTNKAKEYQEGVALTVDENFNPVYTSVDETKLLIKQAALEITSSGTNQLLTLKVAKLDTDLGELAPLDSGEKTAFDNYFINFEIPGIPINKVSLAANIFNFNCLITYYATYDYAGIVSSVNQALIDFRNSFSFNGELYINDLETYIKTTVPGIRNVSLSSTEIDSVSFEGMTRLISGYFNYPANITNNITYAVV